MCLWSDSMKREVRLIVDFVVLCFTLNGRQLVGTCLNSSDSE